ncbi:unnamed protein product [Oncorhynchus mykiss]|uniref:Tc1-like transposase DDE domain-containing protein n=1 Tax=Oncorhynchus mykiss TaxID=8022 RepID=A0A060X8U4_ONCMY|nr:unnamed protein product [Oncorhynchus mykiss]
MQETSLEWAQPEPRLEPIEHLWRDLKIAVQRRSLSNLTELERICREEWGKLPKYRCVKLVESYPRRPEAAIATKGASTKTMTQHTSRLCKGYLTKESDGVLHQMTWPPQSPDLNPIENVWDEFDRRVKEKQPTCVQHMWELLQDCWKNIPGEAGWENARSVQSCHQGKGWLLRRISNIKYTLICLALFSVCAIS